MMTTTSVRMAVAKFEFTPSIPTLAKMDVNAAKTADNKANTNHIKSPFISSVNNLLLLACKLLPLSLRHLR